MSLQIDAEYDDNYAWTRLSGSTECFFPSHLATRSPLILPLNDIMIVRLAAVSRIGATAAATEVQMKNRLRVLRAEKNWSIGRKPTTQNDWKSFGRA
jgi:hypothetical protein